MTGIWWREVNWEREELWWCFRGKGALFEERGKTGVDSAAHEVYTSKHSP